MSPLLAWYKLDGNALDNSGNENHLPTIGTSATPTSTGKIGGCYSFTSGSGIYTSNGIDLPSTVSFSAWAYNNDSYSTNSMIFSCNSSLFSGPDLYFTGTIAWNTGNGAYNAFKNNGINVSFPTTNAWHHYVVVNSYSLNKTFLYVDGAYYGEAVYKDTYQENKGFTIGNYVTRNAGYSWKGMIDDVRIYDHALSPKEIKELSKAKILHYDFDDFQEAGENLLAQPLFMETGYTKESWTGEIEDNSVIAPDGTLTATKIKRLGGYFYKKNDQSPSFNISPGDTITFSCWVKKIDSSNQTGRGIAIWCYSVSSRVVASANQEVFSNKWVRQTVSYTAQPNETTFSFIFSGSSGNMLQGEFAIWHPQLEKKDHTTPFVNGIRTGLVKDISGYENNAVLDLNTTPEWTDESRIGSGAYRFNGTTSGIERIGDISDIKTISMWVKRQTVPTDSRVLLVHRPTGVGLGFYNNGYLILVSEGNNQRTAIISNFKNNDWNHIAVTYSDAKVPICYINGVETTYSATNYWNTSETTLFIGRRTSGSAFNGYIDDVRIYATALSADDIKELYESKMNIDNKGNLSVAKLSQPPMMNGLVAWYPLDGNAKDYSGNGNDGTVNGATVVAGLNQDCYSFDGSNGGINTNLTSTQLSELNNCSISFWYKNNVIKNWLPFGGQSSYYYVMATTGGTGAFYHSNIGTARTIYGDGKETLVPFADTAWHHYTITGITLETWITLSIAGYPSWIPNGCFQDVRIYNRALREDEVRTLYYLGMGII